MEEIQQSTLYIVPTPIGNLNDISIRALNILNGVDIIACEDTRHSLKLLNNFDIKKKLISYHSYNKKGAAKNIVNLLSSGLSIALISDGGTPCISDPGYILINECRNSGYNIVPIPGASAFLTLLSASGFRTDEFFFHGFLSPKNGRKKNQLLKMSKIEATHIIYESPYRIEKTLIIINEIFPKKNVCLGKELTKINENIIVGRALTLLEILKKNKILGEFVLMIANY